MSERGDKRALSKIRTLIVRKHIDSYEHLVWYVFRYCGENKKETVLNNKEYFDYFIRVQKPIRNLAEKECGMQTACERTASRKRGLSGCSMIVERRVKD